MLGVTYWNCGFCSARASVAGALPDAKLPHGWARVRYISKALGREAQTVGCCIEHAVRAAEKLGTVFATEERT